MQSRYGTTRAVNELLAIFRCQWSNGLLPQIRFMQGQTGYRPDAEDWGVAPDISGPTHLRTSGISQPPIMGMCAHEAFRKLTEAERAAYHAEFLYMVEGLERYHAWLLRERDPWGENLAFCLHPWETGTDNSPAFDPLIDSTRAFVEEEGISVETFGRADKAHVKVEHRPTDRDYFAYFGLLALFKAHRYDQAAIIECTPFLLQDVLFNTLLVVSLESLATLQEEIAEMSVGKAEEQDRLRERSLGNRELAKKVALAVRHKLWDEDDGIFYSYDSRGKTLLRTPTVSSLMPLMGYIALPEQAEWLLAHLQDTLEFRTEVPIPSTAANSPAFNPLRYWSGPSWPVTNWLVMRGLRERGSPLAEELRASTLRMIAEGGDLDSVRRAAMSVMEANSFGEEFTTPSRKQYAHAWLWDSAIVALSWPLVTEKPRPHDPQEGGPQFWEYYHPLTGEPLGAPRMTWTASLFLELLEMEG